MKIRDERIEKKSNQVIIRSFVFLNALLLCFVLFYDKVDFLKQQKPNLIVFFIMLITVIYACGDFYISGTLMPQVQDKADMKSQIVKLVEYLVTLDGVGIVVFFLNNSFSISKLGMLILGILLMDIVILGLGTLILYLWLKIINKK
ncbi:hypothetical protein [Lactobacillus taiwanensis]|uniref:hypothetical protein n=1 Tax=Lactobacillus taiwanensis TaxID=508451 RepID=UPI00322087C2